MNIRNFLSAILLAAAVFGSGAAANAASHQNQGDAAFSTKWEEAKTIHRGNPPAYFSREDHYIAADDLRMAKYYFDQGQGDQAWFYLNSARGRLRLPTNAK